MRQTRQSTARNVMLLLVDSTTHVTGLAGLTLTITASKDGAAFASISPTVTDRGAGWYSLALTSSHTDTLGDLAIHATATGADPADALLQVVAYDPADAVRLGLSAIPNAAAGANGGLPVLSSSGTTLAYTVSTLTTYTGNTPQTGDAYARLGAPAGASVSADVAAVAAKTGNLPSDPADASDIAGAFSTVNATLATLAGYVDTEVAAIKAKTDNLPADPAGLSALASAHGAGSWATATGFAVAGDAMTLTAGERTATANEVEAQIIDDADSEKVLEAITDKIAAANPDLSGLTLGAIASAVWSAVTRTLTAGTNIVLAKGTGVTGFNDLSAAQVNAEADAALADAGVTTTVTGRIDAAVSSRSTYAGADTAGTTTLLSRLTPGRADALDNLDAAVTTRLAAADYAAAPGAEAVADTVLRRNAANVEASADGDALSLHSLYGFVQQAQRGSISGLTMTVRKTDNSVLGTLTVTASAGADPVTGIS